MFHHGPVPYKNVVKRYKITVEVKPKFICLIITIAVKIVKNNIFWYVNIINGKITFNSDRLISDKVV